MKLPDSLREQMKNPEFVKAYHEAKLERKLEIDNLEVRLISENILED